jgi:hypothetical protein
LLGVQSWRQHKFTAQNQYANDDWLVIKPMDCQPIYYERAIPMYCGEAECAVPHGPMPMEMPNARNVDAQKRSFDSAEDESTSSGPAEESDDTPTSDAIFDFMPFCEDPRIYSH